MTPREVKLTKRVAMDYMIVGMAFGQANVMSKLIQPEELLTHTGRALYAAATTGDRDTFREVIRSRFGFSMDEKERTAEGLVRIIKESNVDQYAWAVGEQLAEELASFNELADMVEILERATLALKHAQKEREECHVP